MLIQQIVVNPDKKILSDHPNLIIYIHQFSKEEYHCEKKHRTIKLTKENQKFIGFILIDKNTNYIKIELFEHDNILNFNMCFDMCVDCDIFESFCSLLDVKIVYNDNYENYYELLIDENNNKINYHII